VIDKTPNRGGGTPAVVFKSMGKLAVTEGELKKIDVPVKVFVGDRDPVKQLYVEPLQKVRKDWPVVEIKDAGHLTCVAKPEFKDGVVEWLKKQQK
jgi:pimeloyl-ACP methyl ester carboxylesterase